MIFLILFFMLGGLATADVYVLTDANNSVVGLSEQNDMVVPAGSKVNKVSGNISNLPINGDVTMYNFNKGSFSLDKGKVQKQQKQQQDDISAQTAKAAIKVSAIGKLKALGLTEDEIGALKQ